MRLLEKYPPSLLLFTCIALVVTVEWDIAYGAGLALAWWLGHRLDTWGLGAVTVRQHQSSDDDDPAIG